MKISSTLSAFLTSQSDPDMLFQAIRDCTEAGFTVLDFPMCGHAAYGWLDGDECRERFAEARKLAESLGCRFRYAHVPFGYPAAEDAEGWKRFDFRVRRSLESCAVLGIEWAAIHPYDMAQPGYDAAAAHARSVAHLTPYAHIAKELGFGIAVENMVDRVLVPYRRYCSTVENQCAVIDDLRREVGSDAAVGACLDTGHANAAGLDHYAAILALGERLKMLHVNDNNGLGDDHVPPFSGTVRWDRVMQGLRNVHYPGDLNFEVKCSGIPDPAVRKAFVRYLAEIGSSLIRGSEI